MDPAIAPAFSLVSLSHSKKMKLATKLRTLKGITAWASIRVRFCSDDVYVSPEFISSIVYIVVIDKKYINLITFIFYCSTDTELMRAKTTGF